MTTDSNHEDVLLAETAKEGVTIQLIERRTVGCLLRWLAADGTPIRESGALCSDTAGLLEARDLFPECLPWGGIAVDSS